MNREQRIGHGEDKMIFYYTSFATPIGNIYLAGSEKWLCRVVLGCRNEKEFEKELKTININFECVVKNDSCFTEIRKDIFNFLSGKPASFRKHGVIFHGTDFQKKVWKVISNIPIGKVLTYKQIAEKIGAPKAYRAVGSACGANPLPIVIPCHRVVGSNGSLGGFSGGLKIKRLLLKVEGIDIQKIM